MREMRALGTVARFDSSTSIELSLRLWDGVGSVTLDSVTAPFPTLAAGSVYRFPDLCQTVASKIQQWIFDALSADAAITTPPSAPEAIDVDLSFAPSTAPNGSLLTLTIGPGLGGAETTNGAVAIDEATIGGTQSSPWSLLGLVYEADNSRLGTLSNGVASFPGLFQSRLIWVVERSEQDAGDTEEPSVWHAHLLADGSVRTYSVGAERHTRLLRLVDLEEEIAGRPQVIGRVSSVSGGMITISAPDTSTLTGISNLYVNPSLATPGRYVHVPGGWVARERSDSTSSIVLCEEIPSGVTVSAGAPVTMISELHALLFEARRTGYLVVYDVQDEDGSILWTSREYALLTPRYAPVRHSPGAALYTVEWELLRRDKAEITMV